MIVVDTNKDEAKESNWEGFYEGIVATREEEIVVTPGIMVYFPPGEEHWHGATDDSSFAHFSIMADYEEYGFKAVIAKPYSVDQLRKTLRGLLGEKK